MFWHKAIKPWVIVVKIRKKNIFFAKQNLLRKKLEIAELVNYSFFKDWNSIKTLGSLSVQTFHSFASNIMFWILATFHLLLTFLIRYHLIMQFIMLHNGALSKLIKVQETLTAHNSFLLLELNSCNILWFIKYLSLIGILRDYYSSIAVQDFQSFGKNSVKPAGSTYSLG